MSLAAIVLFLELTPGQVLGMVLEMNPEISPPLAVGLILELALGAVLEPIPEVFLASSAEKLFTVHSYKWLCVLQNTDRRLFICCCWKSVGSKRASRVVCPNLCGDFTF